MALALALIASLYAFALFWLARRVETSPGKRHWVDRPQAYALSLAVYCTSWTFFGAVGSAATSGWTYLPIYLGPALLFLFGQGFLRQLASAVQRENLTSIADYISSRYGKSRSVAALVTGLATIAALPYIALQLKALGMSSAEMFGASGVDSAVVAVIAVALALFAIMFGAHRYEATGRNRGLIAAIAVEAIVKLAALTALGVYATIAFFSAPAPSRAIGLREFIALFSPSALRPDFITIILLSMGAIVCLPRQFYAGFVEYRNQRDLSAAHWLFPLYMAITALVVAPITLAGLSLLPRGLAPDLFVLDLPLRGGADWLALLAFLGGFSAATGMVVVECVALSTMISNDLIAPIMLRRARADYDFGARMLLTRRAAIVAIVGLAFASYIAIDRSETLANIGLTSFAAVAQFAPALVAALYWPRSNQRGVRWGLVAGGAVWAYTLLLPTLAGAHALKASGLTSALGGLINPHALFGMAGLDPLTHGVVWSLGLNVLCLVLGSLWAPAAIADRLRAAVFTPGAVVGGFGAAKTNGDLCALVERFLGAAATQRAFTDLDLTAPLTPATAALAERLVAQVIGAPSARIIIVSALRRGSLDVADAVSLIDDTRQELQFSREVLAATLNNISQGVSVVDETLKLIAWNQRYLELFDFPAGFIHVGKPIADVIRFNAVRGECGPGEIDAHVQRRLAHLRQRTQHIYERLRPNGRVLKSIGNPMPGGGYVTSFTDITAEKTAQDALRAANEHLEARVLERTAALSAVNAELGAAKSAAEQATQGKTRFLAAASHDLLQPLNAARLFSAALDGVIEDSNDEARQLARSVERSIAAADSLLRALLDISKLDAGGVTPSKQPFALDGLLADLTDQFAPVAAAKGLRLQRVATGLWINSDRALLRSALQNFLSNALRYTEAGGVLVGARRRGDRVVIEVWDTGCGIPEGQRSAIFREFHRLHAATDESAAGLGLAIVERIARILGASLDLRSTVGRGSVFSIDASLAASPPNLVPKEAASVARRRLDLRVLCVDNETDILVALEALLSTWEARGILAKSYAEACSSIERDDIDVALIDYHLGEEKNGLDVIAAWRARFGARPFAVVTASRSDAIEQQVTAAGGIVLYKPVDPQALVAFLSAVTMHA